MHDVLLDPMQVANELLERASAKITDTSDHSRAIFRAAEAEAWKLRAAHGLDSANGRVLATAALILADRYHDQSAKRDINDLRQYNVPVFVQPS